MHAYKLSNAINLNNKIYKAIKLGLLKDTCKTFVTTNL